MQKKSAEISGGQFDQDWGIVFEFGNSPFAGIDLDHCIDDNGNLANWAADIVATMNSYTEYSSSGHGLHIIFKGEILKELFNMGKQGVRVGNIELYYGVHYFTVTEKPYGETKTVIEASECARKVFDKYLLKKSNKNSNTRLSDLPPVEVFNNLNTDLLEVMFSNSKNGEKIRRLYNGDISDYKSASEADLALCNHLAFYSGSNAFEMDRLFRQSGLIRPKWDEKHGAQTYGEMTITKAIEGTINNYRVAQEYIEQPQKEERIDFEREAVSYYLNDFLQEIQRNREGRAIPTGFENLDEKFDGGLYPGLYFIGANSSLGKTTLILQIADNIAKSGRGVLVFSLEMSRNELIAKSLSRMSLLKSLEIYGHTKYAKTTRGILKGKYNNIEGDLISQSLREYAEFGQNLHISEGLGDVGVKQIKDKILQYIDHNGTPHISIVAGYAETKDESTVIELDGVTACLKALQSLTDARKYKLKSFITACKRRGLILMVDDKRRVYLERMDREPITGDVSDLFTWIYGFSECALLVYLGTQDTDIVEELNMTAARAECDLFTAAYSIARMRRNLYISTCAYWKFKPIEVGIERLKTKCEELKILYRAGYDEDGKPRVFFSTYEVTSIDDMVDFSVRLPSNPALERAFYDYIKYSI